MNNPYLAVVMAGLIWGSTGVFVKILNLPSTTITFFRLAVPTVLLGVYFLIKRKNLFKQMNAQIILASFINGLRMYLYFLAFTLTSIGNAVVMLFTWPLFASVLSIVFLKERLSLRKVFLMCLVFTGMVLMFSNRNFSFKNHDFAGMIAMLASAAMYALTILIFKKQLFNYSKAETIFYQNVVGAIIVSPFIFINKPIPTVMQISIASLSAILIGLVGFFFFFSGLKKLKASTASFLAYIEVVSAFIFGIIIFHETITTMMLLGAGMILLGSFFIRSVD